MKLSDWLPSVFVEGDGDDIQVSTKKFSQFPTATGEGIQGVGIKDGNNVKFELTTDSIKVNPEPFRNAKGQFIGTPEELAGLENQRDVNNFLYNAINDIEAGDIDLDGYATEDWVEEKLGELPGTVVSDAAPADPEEGMCWYDTVRLELFVFAEDAWLPCSPLGARVEQGEIVQAQIVEQIQKSLEDQARLEDKVSHLEGELDGYAYTFNGYNNTPRDGDFNAKTSEALVTKVFAEIRYLCFSLADAEGKKPNFVRIKKGDVVRVTGPAGERAEWYVDVDTDEGTGIVTVGDLVSSEFDEFVDDVQYTFTALTQFDPAGLASIEYVDNRVDTKLDKSGGKMSGVLNMQDNYIAGVKDPASDADAANRRYVKDQVKDALKQDASGHTIVSQEWRLRAKASDAGTWTFIRIANDALGLFHVEDPREWHHAANARYVDDAVQDCAKKTEQNTFTDTQTFERSTYFQNSIIINGKSTDTITEVRGDNEDGTRQRYHKIRGTNRVSWILYPGQENVGYKKCLEMEWDTETNKPLVKLDYLQAPTNERHAATKKYVDEKVAEAGGGSFAETGATTPSLEAGQLFYNTTDKVLYIGE